ncbi:hypothetical protein FHG87_018451 [Trinorchestia longiramus]|nr:hypothetical protein FHG87_018451 [Trinorchestia longiramus]
MTHEVNPATRLDIRYDRKHDVDHIFNEPASCLPSPKPAPRPAKVEDQQLRYFLQKDKITSFDAFKPERNLQKQYKNLIISRSKERLVFLLVDEVQIRTTVSFSGGLLSGMAENNRNCKATSILITRERLAEECSPSSDLCQEGPVG